MAKTRSTTQEAIVSKALQQPFADETALRRIVGRCHDRILFQLGHDPAKAFDEFMQVLLVKLFDERLPDDRPVFAEYPGETVHALAERIRGLLQAAAEDASFAPVFENAFDGGAVTPRMDMDDETIAFVVRHLQDFSLSRTGDLVHGADVKGVVFETMVGSTFRGNLGAYFTPRNIAEFVVRFLNPGPGDRIVDPACGSGGFLIMALKYVRDRLRADGGSLQAVEDFALRGVHGFDINERMARVARMNLVMHGAQPTSVRRINGLLLHREADLAGSFDMCFANPPFAGFESDPSILTDYAVAKTDGGVRSVNKVLPFMEQIVRLLKPGGRAGVVIPISVLNAEAETFVRLREMLFEQTRLLGIVGLTEAAFHHTDCGSHGALFFFERRHPGDKGDADYEVFIDFADSVGYNRLGHAISDNELPEVLARYQRGDKTRFVHASELRAAGRIDPTWWRPSNLALRRSLEQSGNLVSISEFFEIRREFITKRKLAGTRCKFFQVKDADLLTGDVVHVHEADAEELPGRIRQIVRAGDVLLPNHRDSLIAKKGMNGRSAIVVPPELDGVLTTNRFFVLRPKVDPLFLKALLNDGVVRQQLTMQARGGASLDITEEALANVRVPALDETSEALSIAIQAAEQQVRDLREQLVAAEAAVRQAVADYVASAGSDPISDAPAKAA
jgi:type I restriction-modification system DNA methylase subunit